MSKIGKFLICFWRDEGAGPGVEYAVLLIIIALGMAAAAGFLGSAITSALDTGASCLNAGANCSP